MRHDRPSRVLADELSLFKPVILDLPELEVGQKHKEVIKKMIHDTFKNKKLDKTPLVVYGSGRKHHYTYGLCRGIADKLSKKYTYVHIDEHTDMGNEIGPAFSNSYLSCGNFVTDILLDSNAETSLHIGQSYAFCRQNGWTKRATKLKDLMFSLNLKYKKKNINSVRDLFAAMLPEIYVTLDLDVLNEYMMTDFSPGNLSLEELLDTLTKIKQKRKIVGMDICGLGEDVNIDKRSIQTHREIINCVMSGR